MNGIEQKPLATNLNPKTIVLLLLGGILASLLLSAAGFIVLSRQVNETGQQTASSLAPTILGNGQPAQPGLPECPTETATGCDRSALAPTQTSKRDDSCQDTGPSTITASPIALDDLLLIQPMGLMIGGHVTPIDHGYFYVKQAMLNPPQKAAVYSPIDGVITAMHREHRGGDAGTKADASNNSEYDDYSLTIEASCTFRVRFSNLTEFGGPIGERVGDFAAGQSATPQYRVNAGELIGYTAGDGVIQGIDVWVENDDVTLTGFVNPAQYAAAESWKLHMVDFFDYTAEPLKNQLLGFLERDASPRWGKIDYDQDGKLIGNWFRSGSGGYAGKQMGEGYWAGHLAIAPDGNDPNWTILSFGDYQGQAQQFAVMRNEPNPADVTPGTGLVKYEYGQIENYSALTGAIWDHRSYIPNIRTRSGNPVLGTLLVQLTDRRTLRMEIFPNKKSAEIKRFTEAAVTYER